MIISLSNIISFITVWLADSRDAAAAEYCKRGHPRAVVRESEAGQLRERRPADIQCSSSNNNNNFNNCENNNINHNHKNNNNK